MRRRHGFEVLVLLLLALGVLGVDHRSGGIDSAGPPAAGGLPTPADPTAAAGRHVYVESGCAACHLIGDNGNRGPGPALDDIAARLPPAAISRALVDPGAPMPSFAALRRNEPRRFAQLVAFLSTLKG